MLPRVAEALAALGATLGIPVCFKASFDKANRARRRAARGPGLERGPCGAGAGRAAERPAGAHRRPRGGAGRAAAEVVDVLQIPAFLCRQTDLLLAAGRTGKPVNVKKGQWMHAGGDGAARWRRCAAAGAADVAVTERGTFFGYGDLVVDMRNFARLREATGAPVIFDATHAVQQPGQGAAGPSGGLRGAHSRRCSPRRRRRAPTGSFSRPIPIRRGR